MDEKYGDDFTFSGLFQDKSLFLKNSRNFSQDQTKFQDISRFSRAEGSGRSAIITIFDNYHLIISDEYQAFILQYHDITKYYHTRIIF